MKIKNSLKGRNAGARPLTIIEKIYLKDQLKGKFSRFITVTAMKTAEGIKWGAFGLGTYFGRGIVKLEM